MNLWVTQRSVISPYCVVNPSRLTVIADEDILIAEGSNFQHEMLSTCDSFLNERYDLQLREQLVHQLNALLKQYRHSCDIVLRCDSWYDRYRKTPGTIIIHGTAAYDMIKSLDRNSNLNGFC